MAHYTGLAELPAYSEDQLESALLDHLQRFLLELGRGFCFEARQFRMTEGRKHHRVDLVFYLRECELDAALAETRADLAAGRAVKESPAAHLERLDTL